MINFNLRRYIAALERLDIAKSRAMARDEHDQMPTDVKGLIIENVTQIYNLAQALEMPTARHRGTRLLVALQGPTTYGIALREIQELWNALDHDSYEQSFCHYPLDKAKLLSELPENWKSPLAAFPSAKKEIEEGVDCYALGHDTACVFHMCRAAEIGLRIIAKERGISAVRAATVPVEWGTWGQVFKAIEPKIEDIKQKSNGPQKDAALAFYQQILADLRALHSYRDPAMHFHVSYDAKEAQKVMFRTHALLEKLATKLTDQSVGEIPWSSWP